jgi:TATA-box binding protein (TBP) (component of TFIID and TFIIIB)
MNREVAARKIQAAFRRGRRPKANQFVNKFDQFDYALTKPTIVSVILNTQFPFSDISGQPLPAGVDELLGYTTTGTKPVVRKVRGRNAIIGNNKTPTASIKRWAFTINFKNSKAYVSHSESGLVQMNTTAPYERVLWVLHKSYFPGIAESPIKIVKIDTKMYINRYLILDDMGPELQSRIPKSKLVSWSYEPEIMPGAYLKWGDPKVNMIFYTSGVILTQGLTSFKQLDATSKILEEIFSKYGVNKLKVFKYARGGGYTGIAEPAKPVRKNLAAKRARAAGRYELALNWTNTKPGFYVRPGANGRPRFYPLVTDLKLVRPKVIRAYAEAGRNIPKAVRNALGIVEGATPAAKMEGRRATGWNATKNGYYVKPGPGGQPYFYQVPKNKKAARKTVLAAYQKAGVVIPPTVRNLFGIAENAAPAPAPTKHYVNYNAQGGLRINGKQFSRYTQGELVQIARNLGIAQVNSSTKLANIARYIKNAVGDVNTNVNATVNGVPVVFMNNGRVKRAARARQWNTLKVAEQNALAKAFLDEEEFATYGKLAKKERYSYILGMKKYKREQSIQSAAANAEAAGGASVSSKGSSSASSLENFARNVELEMRARNLLGPNASSANVTRFKNVLAGLPTGVRGGPKAANVKKALKEFQRNKMYSGQLENIRRKYAANVKVPSWLPRNLRNSYKETLVNIATAPNNKGRLPNQEAVKRGIKAWLNQRLPQVGRASYEKENVITGAIIKVPGWDPTKRKSPNLPNQPVRRLGPERKRKPKSPMEAPHVGPIKKAKKDPRENVLYLVPRQANAENLVNAIAELGLAIGPSNKYSWTYLKEQGLNNRFYDNWLNYTKSPEKPLNVNAAKAKLNGMKTAKARHEWTVAHRNSFSKENYSKVVEHRKALNDRNKARRAAKRNQAH